MVALQVFPRRIYDRHFSVVTTGPRSQTSRDSKASVVFVPLIIGSDCCGIADISNNLFLIHILLIWKRPSFE